MKLIFFSILFLVIFAITKASGVIVSTNGTFNTLRSLLIFSSIIISAILFFAAITRKRVSSSLKVITGFIVFPFVFLFSSCQAYFTFMDGPHLESLRKADASEEEKFSPFGLVLLKDGSTAFLGYDWDDIAVVYRQTQLSRDFYKKEIVCKADYSYQAITFVVSEADKIECTTHDK